MKRLLLLILTIITTTSTKCSADGCFLPPKFGWDKHKDINEPTQNAIIVYDAGKEDLILQVKYEGPVNEFGWLIPVPNLPKVESGSMKCFYELSRYTQRQALLASWRSTYAMGSHQPKFDESSVKVVEAKTVGAYEIAVLSTRDSGALANWLETNQYYFPTNTTGVLESYIKQQWYFIAVKVNLDKSRSASAAITNQLANGELNPLQISFDSDHCIFPLKISSANGKPSEVQIYVLSPEPLLAKTMLDLQLAE
jgi:hypothetical protein